MNGQSSKRAAEEFMRREQDQDSKKPRFDYRNPSTLAPEEVEEDAILDLDEIGKGGLQSKRKAVRLEGYESDSSEENFEARADAKAEAQKGEKAGKGKDKSKDEDENDMFADLEDDLADGDDDEDLAKEGKKRKKEVRFMNEKDIEGQVINSKSGGHVSADFSLDSNRGSRSKEHESSSEESADEEIRDRVEGDMDEELGAGGKKKHAPKLDAFNMQNEAEEGKFDESGNFVRNATDPFAVHDSWLEGSSKAEMKRAKEAHEKREEDRRRRDVADDAVSTSQILATLIRKLENGETILEALARYGTSKSKQKKKAKWQKNKKKDSAAMDVDAEEKTEEPEERRRREAVESITAAADQLLTRGQTDVYDDERAVLMRQYKRETGEDWVDQPPEDDAGESHASKQWEYRWSDARDGGETHGPYDAPTMVAWNEAGYFGEEVVFREVGTERWKETVDFT